MAAVAGDICKTNPKVKVDEDAVRSGARAVAREETQAAMAAPGAARGGGGLSRLSNVAADIARAQRTALGDVDVTMEREAADASGTGASEPVLDEAATGKAGVSLAESTESTWEVASRPYVKRKIKCE